MKISSVISPLSAFSTAATFGAPTLTESENVGLFFWRAKTEIVTHTVTPAPVTSTEYVIRCKPNSDDIEGITETPTTPKPPVLKTCVDKRYLPEWQEGDDDEPSTTYGYYCSYAYYPVETEVPEADDGDDDDDENVQPPCTRKHLDDSTPTLEPKPLEEGQTGENEFEGKDKDKDGPCSVHDDLENIEDDWSTNPSGDLSIPEIVDEDKNNTLTSIEDEDPAELSDHSRKIPNSDKEHGKFNSQCSKPIFLREFPTQRHKGPRFATSKKFPIHCGDFNSLRGPKYTKTM